MICVDTPTAVLFFIVSVLISVFISMFVTTYINKEGK